MQNQIQSAIASNSFAAVRVFGTVPVDRRRFADEFQIAGFAPWLGFESPDGKTVASRVVNDNSVSSGSVVVVEESSLSTVQSQLQFAGVDRSSLYLVVLAEGGTEAAFEEQAFTMQAGLSREYRRASVVPANVDEARLAREAAALVRSDRTDPKSALLWIIDDQPHRFRRGGCWAGLAEAAQSVPGLRNRLRVVRSLVEREAVMGSARRTELVSVWRREILEPAARNGTRVVLVTRSRSSGGDAHIGEAWASTVLQWLPSATAFVASRYQVDLRRRPGEGIWLGEDDRLVGPDRERIFEALGSREAAGSRAPRTSPQADPATALSSAPIRAVALSSVAFSAAWADLLSLDEPEILRRLHDALTSHGPLDPVRRAALREALGWNEKLAELLAAAPSELSEWVAAVPGSAREQAIHAWLTELTETVVFQESQSETELADAVVDGSSLPCEPTPSRARRYQPDGVIQAGDESSPRFTFLSVMDEWSSRRGGLTTFNRELCLALARCGHRVQCLVIHADDAEVGEAAELDVDLLRLEQRPGEPPLLGLYLRGEIVTPPDFILGHGRVTGQAAIRQAEYYPDARRIHFVHTSPEAIEPLKAMGRAAGDFATVAYERSMTELELSHGAALVVAVGPRLYREIATRILTLRPRPRVHRLDPGIPEGYDPERRELPPGVFCLLSGRIEDHYLKGVDIAAAALGRLAGRAERYYGAEITFVVRGVESGKDAETIELVRKHAGADLGDIRIRRFVADRGELARDQGEASLVLMPSREEGFGLVGLEAIAAGTPVLVSSRSGLAAWLSEVEPDLAHHFIVHTSGDDPENVARWADAIDLVLTKRERAFERAARLRASLGSKCTWAQAAHGLTWALAGLRMQA